MICKLSTRNGVPAMGIFVSLFLAVLSTEHINRFSKKTPVPTSKLISLGTVEGRAYFAETSTEGSWTASQKICKDAGMHLASITSKGQAAFIKNSTASLISSPYYWLGGRDSQKMSQLVWDYNNVTPVDGILVMDWRAGVRACLALFTDRNSNQRFEGYACDGQKSMFTLCEKAVSGSSDENSVV